MEPENKIQSAENFVKNRLKGYDGSHDWWHIERVRNLARYINNREGSADPFVLDMATILHDYADTKFNSGTEEDRYAEIMKFLDDNEMDSIKNEIILIVKNVSFSRRSETGNLRSPELLILQDADKLDAMGAIGIARAFNYGGFRNNPIYLPGEVNGGQGKSTIGHFYDKLLKLKDMMNTVTARELAVERHKIMLEFLDIFYSEWMLNTIPA